jgi:hypothetical protein
MQKRRIPEKENPSPKIENWLVYELYYVPVNRCKGSIGVGVGPVPISAPTIVLNSYLPIISAWSAEIVDEGFVSEGQMLNFIADRVVIGEDWTVAHPHVLSF